MVVLSSFRSVHHREDVVLAEDHVLDAVELHFGAGVFAEEDAVPFLDGERAHLPGLHHLAVAGRDDDPLDGLLLGGVRNDDAAFGLLLLLQALHNETIGERTNLHWLCVLPPASRARPPPATREAFWHSSCASASAAEAKT